jgi:rhodanese-related sulfurtransferase
MSGKERIIMRASLADQGDNLEKEYWSDLKLFFPAYEAFWQLHIYPLRSTGMVYLREQLDEDVERMAILHFSTYVNLGRGFGKIKSRAEDFKYFEEICANLYRASELAGDTIEQFKVLYRLCIKKEIAIHTEKLVKASDPLRLYRNLIHGSILATRIRSTSFCDLLIAHCTQAEGIALENPLRTLRLLPQVRDPIRPNHRSPQSRRNFARIRDGASPCSTLDVHLMKVSIRRIFLLAGGISLREHGGGPAVAFALIAISVVVLCLTILIWTKRTRDQQILQQRSITPEALHTLLASNQEILILDVRQPLDFLADTEIIPGAKRIPPREVLENPSLIPREKDSVAYCTCPGDKTARSIIRRARALHFDRVKFLKGGLAAWKAKGYPVELYLEPFHLDTAS